VLSDEIGHELDVCLLDRTRLRPATGNAMRCVGEFERRCREFLATVRSRYRDERDA